jgi:selenophosphate synthase
LLYQLVSAERDVAEIIVAPLSASRRLDLLGTLVTHLPADDSARELRASLACDAQTSGGLLLCVPPERAGACVTALAALGLPAARIGELVDGEPVIELR